MAALLALLGLLLALSACSRGPAGSIIHKIPVSGSADEGDTTAQPGLTLTPFQAQTRGALTPTATAQGAPDQAGFRIDYPTKAALPDGALNITYEPLVFLVSGGFSPYLFSIDKGALPPGMAFSRDGQLSGRPSQTGDFAFTVGVRDGLFFFPHTLRKDYTLHVGVTEIPVYVTETAPPWPIISPTPNPGEPAPRPTATRPLFVFPPTPTPHPLIISTDTVAPPPTNTPLPPPTATPVPPTLPPAPTRTLRPTHTPRAAPTNTPVPLPTNTFIPIPPTDTPVPPPPPTDTPVPPPPPTDTPVPPPPPTDTAVPPPAPTDTAVPLVIPTDTVAPPPPG